MKNKRKNKKGFTLIELLAVLVVLAILALITTPIVLNVIKKAREGADERSADAYVRALDNAVTTCLSKYPNEEVGELYLSHDGLTILRSDKSICSEVSVKGKKINDMGGDQPISLSNNKITLGDEFNYLQIGKYTFKIADGENKAVTPKPKSESLAEDSWDTIAAYIKAGKANYQVGDTKCVAINGMTTTNENGCSNGEFLVRLANTSTPNECKDSNFSQTACGYVFEFVDVITEHNMNDTNTNVGGYPSSSMHAYLKDELYKKLPDELTRNIIETKTVSGHGSTTGESNFISEDKLYLLSPHEVWENGTSNTISADTGWNQTRQLDYYKNNNVTTNNYASAIKKYNGSDKTWWLRAAHSNYTNTFYIVFSSGDWGNNNVSSTNGVAPGFRIG